MRCCVICSHKFTPHPQPLLDEQLCSLYFIKFLFPQELLSPEQIVSLISSGASISETVEFCAECHAQILECKSIWGQLNALQEQHATLKAKIKKQILLITLNRKKRAEVEVDVYTEIRKRLREVEEDDDAIADLTFADNSSPPPPPICLYGSDVNDNDDNDDDEMGGEALSPMSSTPSDTPKESIRKYRKTEHKKTDVPSSTSRKSALKQRKTRKSMRKRNLSEEFQLKLEPKCELVIKEEFLSESEEADDDIPDVEEDDTEYKPRKKRSRTPRIKKAKTPVPPIVADVPIREGKRKYVKKQNITFNCPICPCPSFPTISLLLTHLQKGHAKEETLPKFWCDEGPCSQARKGFLKVEWLHCHQQEVHNHEKFAPPTTMDVESEKTASGGTVDDRTTMTTEHIDEEGNNGTTTMATENDKPMAIKSTEHDLPVDKDNGTMVTTEPGQVVDDSDARTTTTEADALDNRMSTEPSPPAMPSRADRLVMAALEGRTCPKCYKIFVLPSAMREHFDHVHKIMTQLPFMCHICPKSYKRKLNLLQHLKEHEGGDTIPAFGCVSCPRRFRRKVDLDLHARIHTGAAGLLFCSICGMGFRQHFSLKRHNILRHNAGGGETFDCKLCGKKFKIVSHLKQHMASRTHGGMGSAWKRVREKKPKAISNDVLNYSEGYCGGGSESANNSMHQEAEISRGHVLQYDVHAGISGGSQGASSSMSNVQWTGGWWVPP